MNYGLLAAGPFVTLMLAVGLRLFALTLPQISRDRRRRLITIIAYAFMAVSVFGMLFLVPIAPPVGIVGGLSVTMFLMFFVANDLKFAGMRNRARQTEFIWVLTMAVESGRPLADEIEAYAQGSQGKRRRLLIEMVERLREGTPLTELVVPQDLLPEGATMQIHSGITSQSLLDSMMRTAKHATEEFADDQEFDFPGTAFAYPPTLMIFVSLIVGFVMYYIIPKFKRIFDDFNTELPDFTIGFIRLSDAIVNNWLALGLPALVYLPVGICVLVGYFEYHGWMATLRSFLGRRFVRWYTPDVLRSLAQSLRQNVSMKDALTPIVRYAGPVHLRSRLNRAMEAMADGVDSWQALQSCGVIDGRETAVLQVAQRTGNLPWALDILASKIERRRTFRVRAFLEFLQPMLLFPIGAIVGCVAIAFFLPLVKLLNDLS